MWFAMIVSVFVFVIIPLSAALEDNSHLDYACGERKVKHEGLITAGYPSREGDWPWHVAMYHNEKRSFEYKCGGSIITPNAVLTAAHCLVISGKKINPERILLKLGKYNLKVSSLKTEEYQVQESIVHEGFNHTSFLNDIAILKLSTTVKFNNYIQPICLWKTKNDELEHIVGDLGTVVGWGLDGDSKFPDILSQGTMPIVGFEKCLSSNRDFFSKALNENVFCAGYKNGTSVCNGDSGGGMFFKIESTWHIRGIVSFTSKKMTSFSCDPKEYVVFTDVSRHLDWIEINLRSKNHSNFDYAEMSLVNQDNCGPNWHTYGEEEEEKPLFLQYRWVALLEYTYVNNNLTRVLCHGALINQNYVLTAAHCVANILNLYKLTSIRLGEYNLNTTLDCIHVYGDKYCSPPTQTIEVKSFVVHPLFNKPKFSNDIALIRLAQPADFSKVNVRPICLPTTDFLMKFKHNAYTQAGWRKSGRNSEIIARRSADVIDSAICQKRYSEQNIQFDNTNGQICIQSESAHQKKCSSIMAGAPLQAISSFGFYEQYFLYGLLSFGATKCEDDFPEVFTNVQRYLRWIFLNIEP